MCRLRQLLIGSGLGKTMQQAALRGPDDICKGRIGFLQGVEDGMAGGVALDLCAVQLALL